MRSAGRPAAHAGGTNFVFKTRIGCGSGSGIRYLKTLLMRSVETRAVESFRIGIGIGAEGGLSLQLTRGTLS